MNFTSKDAKIRLQDLGFVNLPPDFMWSSEFKKELAFSFVEYIANNLDKKEIWVKFEFILDLIFQDLDFYQDFEEALGKYTGSREFARTLLLRAKNREIIWSPECVVLFDRIERMHKKFIDKGNSYL